MSGGNSGECHAVALLVELMDLRQMYLGMGRIQEDATVESGVGVCAPTLLPARPSMYEGNINNGTCQHL